MSEHASETEKNEAIERFETTKWWASFYADGYEPDPIAFGPTEAECRENTITQFMRDDPDMTREQAETQSQNRGGPDITYMRVALRLAIVNDFQRADEVPQTSWLDGRDDGTVDNTCEHGDHPAPLGQRFCSLACMECEETEAPADKECAEICVVEGGA
jgi:hypothetical protein